MINENDKNKKSENSATKFRQKKGNNLTILFIIGIVFLMIFITFISLLSLNKKDEGKSIEKYKKEYIHIEKAPSQVIESSKKAMKDLRTAKFDGKMKISAIMAIKNQTIPINFSYITDLALAGYADKSDLDNIKTQFNLDTEIDISSEGGSEEMSFDIDCISIGEKDFYYKLNDYDLGIMGMMMGSELNNYKGKWLAKESSDKKDYDPENSSSSLDPKKISKIYTKYELLKFEKDLGDKKLKNVEVYHYKMKLNSAELMDLMEELQFQTEENNNEDKEKLLNEIFKNVNIELWIGKKDKFLRQVKVYGNYDTEDFKQIVGKAYGETEAKEEDKNIRSKISSTERRLKSHYKRTESYNDFSIPSYYAEKIKPENIITSKDSYAIWKEMASTTDKWCIDSTGKSGYVQEEIKGPVCPEISIEPQGEKKDYEEYAYNFFDEGMGPEGKVEAEFDLSFLFSEFNKPLEIKKPKDVEKITEIGSNLFNFGEDTEDSYKSGNPEDGYVMGESVSAHNENEGMSELFDLFK